VATAIIDGISTRYEVVGSGPPLLMYSPAGFNAAMETWRTQGVYAKIKLLDHLPAKYTCITFDRRECGQSGGRVERVNWEHFVRQGIAVLDHLKIDKAHIMGGCMGCSPVIAMGTQAPERVLSMVIYWPVGGPKYRRSSHQRFAEHLAFVHQNGMQAVVDLVLAERKSFAADPRGGPWASVLSRDAPFAAAFVRRELSAYEATVKAMGEALFDRDTSPGAEPEDLMKLAIPALIVPGRDESHATSAARYLEECLPKSEYWDVLPDAQVEATAPARLIDFLKTHS